MFENVVDLTVLKTRVPVTIGSWSNLGLNGSPRNHVPAGACKRSPSSKSDHRSERYVLYAVLGQNPQNRDGYSCLRIRAVPVCKDDKSVSRDPFLAVSLGVPFERLANVRSAAPSHP